MCVWSRKFASCVYLHYDILRLCMTLAFRCTVQWTFQFQWVAPICSISASQTHWAVYSGRNGWRKLEQYFRDWSQENVLSSNSSYKITTASIVLPTRIHEHAMRPTGTIKQHKESCHCRWKITVVATEKDAVNLRIREALAIRSLQPTLNSRDELAQFGLLF